MFEFQSRIRFSETDENLKLTLPALLNYFQDCSTFQSESVGDTIKSLKANHSAWILVSWQLEINRLPSLNDEVTVGTTPYSFRRCSGQRNYCMKDSSGEILAYADTAWGLIDTQEMKLLRIPDEIQNLYPLGERMEIPNLGKHIRFSGEPVAKTSVSFSRSDQDTNHHVNNVRTVAAAWDLVNTDKKLIRMRTDYRKQLFGGDSINAYLYTDENRYIVTFENTDGEITTVCEFTTE